MLFTCFVINTECNVPNAAPFSQMSLQKTAAQFQKKGYFPVVEMKGPLSIYLPIVFLSKETKMLN